tara:strand:- start:2063 stop:2635 length:573 start_codon:yes stop_codon:yes gene_type:complete
MRKLYFILLFSLLIAENDRSYKLDKKSSNLLWKAKKVTGAHWGDIELKKGIIKVDKDGLPISGEFVVDMSTIRVLDAKGSPWGINLENHLHSNDFFHTEKYPEAFFYITNSKKTDTGVIITGEMIIKGVKSPIEFSSRLSFSADIAIANGKIEIDRTLFNIKYRSGKFFSDLGDKMIDDIFTIEFDIKGE